MEVLVKHTITDQMIEDLIVTALEGGSNYWYLLKEDAVKIIKDATPDMEGEPIAIRLTKAVLMDDNVQIPVHDIEDESDELGKITQANIKHALQEMVNNHEDHFNDLLEDNMDATTGDVFFQLVVMQELTFG